MTVYVDDMYRYPMGQFGYMKMSHMIATTDAELHRMAQSIGVARRHYQDDHYDICLSYREKAVQKGAVEVTMRQLACIRLCWRWGRKFKSPEHAYELIVGKRRGNHPKASNKARKSKEVSVSRTRTGRHWQIRLC